MKKDYFIISLVFFLATLVFYGYFWFFVPGKLQFLYQNWDGPNYIHIAQTFYNPQLLGQMNIFGHDPTYYANHFPLYPIFIRLFSFIGYYRSMLFVSLLFSLLFLLAFYKLISELKISPNPLWIVLPLIFFPSRWFIVSHVGSSEPVFLFFLTLFLLYFQRQKYWSAAVFAALAQLARPQGILICLGLLGLFIFEIFQKKIDVKNLISKYFPFILVPLALALVFFVYLIQYGDFFAFFRSISSYHHLQMPPFNVFSFLHLTTSLNIWKEIYIYFYLIYFLAIYSLFQKKLYLFAFISLAYFLPLPFLVHTDISRYSLPLLPLAYIAFSKLIESIPFRYGILFILPAIFAQSLNFTLLNLSP